MRIVLNVVTLILLLTSNLVAQDRKHIQLDPKSELPLSDGVVVGDTLYIGGHLGLDQDGKVPSSLEEEVRLVMEATKKTVEAAGMTMDDVVSIQIACPDLSAYDTFNKVYRTYFHGHYPARAFLGSGKLLRDAHFEVLGVAVKGSSKSRTGNSK